LKSRFVIAVPLVILFWLWVLEAVAQPEDAIVLTDDLEQYPLGLHLELLEDKNKEWTIDDVTSPEIAPLFVPSNESAPGLGFTDSAYWIRFQVKNEANADVDWLLLFNSQIFYIDVYRPTAIDGEYKIVRTGTARPFDSRDIAAPQFVFRLFPEVHETEAVYLRIASSGSMIVNLTILSEGKYVQQVFQQQVVNGILYGIILILGVYNFILFLYLRDNTYLYYVLFFTSVLIGIMALDGFAAQYLWPEGGILGATGSRFFIILSSVFALLLAVSFLRTKEYAPRLHKLMIGLAIIMSVVLGLMYIWFRETALIHIFLLIASAVAMIVAGLLVWRRGYEPARYYLFGWLVFIVGFAILFLTLADIVPFSNLTNIIPRLGLIILALVLSIGLAARLNLYREEKVEAQLAVSYQRVQIAQDLHDSVTQSLYSANLFAEAGRETLEGGDEQGASHYFVRIGQTTQQALKEMRLFLYELRPPDVVETGLVDALQQRIDAVEKRSGMEARLMLDGSTSFPPQVSDQYYRIAQEALNNVLKHARAENVTVYLRGQNGLFSLEIVDDGQGFDLQEAEHSGGMGLKTMRERAERIDGRFVINTTPGQGTSVKVEVEKDGD